MSSQEGLEGSKVTGVRMEPETDTVRTEKEVTWYRQKGDTQKQ